MQELGKIALELVMGDARKAEIRGYWATGISTRSIARLVGCSPSTLSGPT
jgi:hypothetical protein